MQFVAYLSRLLRPRYVAFLLAIMIETEAFEECCGPTGKPILEEVGAMNPLCTFHSLTQHALSGRSVHLATDVQNLVCTVYFVDRSSLVKARDLDDWELGKHGVYVQFPDPRTGKLLVRAYLPQTISRRGASRCSLPRTLHSRYLLQVVHIG